MDMPLNEKQKRAIFLIGVTAAVYVSFRYLLPLVIPFLLAFLLAKMIEKPVLWLHKKFHLKKPVGAVLMLLLLGGTVGIGLWFLLQNLIRQLIALSEHLPAYMRYVDFWVKDCCSELEKLLHLETDSLIHTVYEMGDAAGAKVRDQALPFVMDNSMNLAKWVINISAISVIVVISSILITGEKDEFNRKINKSLFREEITMLSRKLGRVGSAYLKSQLVIMTLTACICVIGLWLLGYQYALVIGIGIGLLDALPIFGTGTVFIPWVIISIFSGSYLTAAGLATTYLICYFLREFMEARVMGDKIGISPLQTLIAMYVGLKLFGLIGFLLGPAGYLIIRELGDAPDDCGNCEQ